MTVDNCIRLLGEYKAIMEDPKSNSFQKRQAAKAHKNMKEHMETSNKFKNYKAAEEEEENKEDGTEPTG